MTATLTVEAGSPLLPEVAALFDEAARYYEALYPPDSNHLLPASALVDPSVDFLVLRVDGLLVGCGALVARDGYGEIKRMFVRSNDRGRGGGAVVLAELLKRARARGINILRLEVGIRQPTAIALYTRNGFEQCGPFGAYKPDPLSLFMELKLEV